MKPFTLLFTAFLLTSCVVARMSAPTNLPPLPHVVSKVAIASSGGTFADTLTFELMSQGLRVQATGEALGMVRDSTGELETIRTDDLKTLKERGIDVLISCRTVLGYDSKPDMVTVKMVSTHNGDIIGGITWQNGYSGQKGSLADRDMRKDGVTAAKAIAKELHAQLTRKTVV